MNAESWAKRSLWVWGASILLLLPAFYWLHTGQVWEDFLITFRHSENLVHGHGLSYHEGIRLHGFTSPLNVLVPALMLWLSGAPDYALPLLLTNVVTLTCLALGGWFGMRTLGSETPTTARWTVWLWPLLLATTVKVAAYTVNGQEAGYWVLFLGISFAASVRGLRQNWILAGIGWGGLLWTRPDAPVHIALLAAGAWFFPRASRRDEWAGGWRAALLGAVIYLPWLTWAWTYYGSPLPHSALAKNGAYAGISLSGIGWENWGRLIRYWASIPFMPIYGESGGWPAWFNALAATMGLGAGGALFARDRVARIAAVGFLGSLGYLAFMSVRATVFPWYAIPAAFFATIALSRWLVLANGGRRAGRIAALIVAGAMIGTNGFGFVRSLSINRLQQELIENGGRQKVGQWLQAHFEPGDRVYLEPIGYIGYYCGGRVLDYPGLVSPEVVKARREHGLDFIGLINYLKPEWLVLRPRDLPYALRDANLLQDYALEAEFDATTALKQRDVDRSLAFLWFDSHYFIFHRLKGEPSS